MKRLSSILPALAGFALNIVLMAPALADDTPAPDAGTTTAPAATTQAATSDATAAPVPTTRTTATEADAPTAALAAATGTLVLGDIKVEGRRLNRARDTLNPETGTSSYSFTSQTIAALPQGENTSLQNLVLQAPGVAKDSFGQLHVRGDHLDLQYRINGTIVPEFINGFGEDRKSVV